MHMDYYYIRNKVLRFCDLEDLKIGLFNNIIIILFILGSKNSVSLSHFKNRSKIY